MESQPLFKSGFVNKENYDEDGNFILTKTLKVKIGYLPELEFYSTVCVKKEFLDRRDILKLADDRACQEILIKIQYQAASVLASYPDPSLWEDKLYRIIDVSQNNEIRSDFIYFGNPN